MSIFLCADSVTNRKMLKMLLSKIGIDCELATCGQEAVDAVTSRVNHFSIIFM